MERNTSLSRKQLVDYIKVVKDLETLKYMQLRARDALQNRIYEYNRIVNTSDYSYVQAGEKRRYRTDSDFKTNTLWGIYLGGLVGAIFGMSLTAEEVQGGDFLGALILDFGEMFLGALKGFLFVGLCVLIIAYFIDRKNKRKAEKEYDREFLLENQRVNQENQRIRQQNTALEQRRVAARKRIEIYNREIRKINKELARIENLLTNYYKFNVIYPKYRNNMIYICSLYEYFDAQRCDALVGPNGAYNLLENDIKFGVIVGRLDMINSKLDQVIDNQRELYYAIEQCNSNISKLGKSLDGLAGQMDSLGARQEEYLQRIDYNVHAASEYQRIQTQFAFYQSMLS